MTNLEDRIQKTHTPRREFLKTILGGIAGGLSYLMSNNLFARPDDLDLPIDPRAGQRAVDQTPPPPAWVDDEPPTFNGEAIYGATQSIIYVIDQSGSMRLAMGPGVGLDGTVRNMTRDQRSKVELVRSIMALAPNFRFNVISYAACVVNPWQRGLVSATEENKQIAYRWINSLLPVGQTGTGVAVSTALLSGEDNRDIVLLTDGAPNCEETIQWHRDIIRRNNRNRTRIHVFGIAANGPYRQFCVNVASDSGGSYHDVR